MPDYGKIHNVFHVSLLERATPRKGGNATQLTYIPLDSNIDIESEDTEYVVSELVDSAIFEPGKVPGKPYSEGGLFYLVDWAGQEEFERTWEPFKGISHLRRLIRQFHADSPDKPDGRKLIQSKRHTKPTKRQLERDSPEPPKRQKRQKRQPAKRKLGQEPPEPLKRQEQLAERTKNLLRLQNSHSFQSKQCVDLNVNAGLIGLIKFPMYFFPLVFSHRLSRF